LHLIQLIVLFRTKYYGKGEGGGTRREEKKKFRRLEARNYGVRWVQALAQDGRFCICSAKSKRGLTQSGKSSLEIRPSELRYLKRKKKYRGGGR